MSAQLYVISAPSGAGKTSLVKALLECTGNLAVSVSHTTRAPRPGEINGQDYHFTDTATFEKMLSQGAFLEYARVFDNYYGTSLESVQKQLQDGTDVILEIDWQGAEQIKQTQDCVSLFILPPSRDTLLQRLRGRKQDSEETIARRMREAVNDMSHHKHFDYLVINDDFDTALADLQAVIRSRRLLHAVQKERHADLLGSLLA